MTETPPIPPLPPIPRLRPGYTMKDACEYAGVKVKRGTTMDDIRKGITEHAKNNDPRRTGGKIETVEQAERAINHWATAPYVGCGNYPLGMTACDAVNMNGDCPRTKFCVFAEQTREMLGAAHCKANGYSTDETLDAGEARYLCVVWDPEECSDNYDEFFAADS